jgi:L-lactate transport
MWQQNYTPIGGSVGLSATVAALPIFVMLFLLGVQRRPAWVAALAGLGTAAAVALVAYHMPVRLTLAAAGFGAAFGLFPISWILFWAIALYRMTVETGGLEVIKDSIGGLTQDRRLQALFIAVAFSAFLEGAAGFGAPVAVAAAMLGGLGFPRFTAANLCLVANTAPVAFGSLGIPILTLALVTRLPARDLSVWVGRICAPMAAILPAYVVLVMGGLPALKGVLPAAALCGAVFGATEFLVSNFIGPQLTNILSSLLAIVSLMLLLKFWSPKDKFVLADESAMPAPRHHGAGRILAAWLPYLLLVAFVLLWSAKTVTAPLDRLTIKFPWPGLHNVVQRMPPVVPKQTGYAALFTLNSLTASGTACMFAVLSAGLLAGVSARQFSRVLASAIRQLALAILTIALVLALAFVMNYSGATTTLGLAFAATGRLFPFFSALLGWLGVFLVSSDTSSNALFGDLQVVTAGRLGLDPVLMAASNSSGGVMGKMISLSSIAVAAAATGMPPSDEAKLFRSTLKHSLILAVAIGLIVAVYSRLEAGH